MERNESKKVRISEMPFGKKFEEYSEDTDFILDDNESEDTWDEDFIRDLKED